MIKGRLWDIALCFVAVAALSMAVSKAVYGWGSVFSYRLFWIMSGSMEPAIREDQIVVGKLTGDGELTVGEIYAYQREGMLGKEMVIHRLVGITEEGGYIFPGDNNMEPDRAVLREQIGYRIVWY